MPTGGQAGRWQAIADTTTIGSSLVDLKEKGTTPHDRRFSYVAVLLDNAYLSLGKRLHFRGPTLPVIAMATSKVVPAVLLFVEEMCQVLRFETNSVPQYQ